MGSVDLEYPKTNVTVDRGEPNQTSIYKSDTAPKPGNYCLNSTLANKIPDTPAVNRSRSMRAVWSRGLVHLVGDPVKSPKGWNISTTIFTTQTHIAGSRVV